MKHNYNYLQDSTFLKEFDKERLKEQYIKITVLTFSEKPIQAIQGRVLGGSLNIDGNSSIRRTCNLTMVAENVENDLTRVDSLISINKKIKLEIGFLNTTDKYKNFDILWFPLGLFVINSASIVHNLNNVNISLQLKDKMCLLNGECGGIIPAATTFHEYETVDENGKYVILKPTIFQIIQELVNHFGGEQLSKIIISDIDTHIKQVMKWTGNSPLYIITNADDSTIQYIPTMSALEAATAQSYNTYEYGDDIGYIYTDFTYPGELIGDAGDSVCSILDEIKGALGNYEYFYDLDGNFVFQEVKNYLNTTQAKVELDKMSNSDYLVDMTKGKSVYQFDNSVLITSYSNSPQYNMIKNDFIVWGLRKTNDGYEFPIRYHLAIDRKPNIKDISYEVFFYEDEDTKLIKAKCPIKINGYNNFPRPGIQGFFYIDTNETPIDSDGKLYYNIYKWNIETKDYDKIENVEFQNIQPADWRTVLYLSGCEAEPLGVDSNYYYAELANEWPKLYDVEAGAFYEDVINKPSDIDFYLDFIDSTTNISELSVENIGRRQKVIVDDSVNCVFEPEIPDLILLNTGSPTIEKDRLECEQKKQDYIQMDETMFSMVAGGGSFNSAYNLVRELLYQYTSYNESIVLNSIPIYHLDANTRVSVRDVESGIYGDYMIKNISVPLDISSTMSISCVRALERI